MEKTIAAIVGTLMALIVVGIAMAISWAFIAGIIYLACLCFAIPFTIKMATGIWLVCLVLKWIFESAAGKSK